MKVFIVVPSALLISLAACCPTNQKKPPSGKIVQTAASKQFGCLPNDVKADDIVSYGDKNVSVQEKLLELQADCVDGRLVDGNKREIRFFRVACFGNPPYNYDEIRQREQEEIERLKQIYTVIVIECNPMIM
ncbi:MAG: hypothetical protein ONB46_18810 [candidate division KSB1 bacterium]|nr:hypothetical protein [candidate division KSB1 bacterium]MDZ7367933.1 hypothetical protein [candidate division KSB1 bacterium]MDZ7406500.1 hypothetical protein [candidate division KSB1 bacterium]